MVRAKSAEHCSTLKLCYREHSSSSVSETMNSLSKP